MHKTQQSSHDADCSDTGNIRTQLVSPQHALTQRDAASSAFLKWVELAAQDRRELSAKLAMLEREMACLQSSRSLQIGQALREATDSWRASLALPRRIFRLLRGDVARPEVPPLSDCSRAEYAPLASANFSGSSSCASVERVDPLPPKILGVVDELTEACLRYECELFMPEPWCPDELLEQFSANLLFVESAWRGNNGAWSGRLHDASPPLIKLIRFCRQRGIPTVFWNKEDPVHFDQFVAMAAHFDIVLTTDEGSIEAYRQHMPGVDVHVFPFACQPRIHNPLLATKRGNGFSFAGSYYTKHVERAQDFEVLVDLANEFAPVRIFDRNHGSDDPMFAFPEKFKPMIVGALDASSIAAGHTASWYSINVNTVKSSPTMFSRRVFELMASGTVVLSNPSVGMQRLFGGLVLADENLVALRQRLHHLVKNPLSRRRIALLGLRKVLAEHTWADRVALLEKLAGKPQKTPWSPSVMVICKAENDVQLLQLVDDFERQTYVHRKMVMLVPQNLASYPVNHRIMLMTHQDDGSHLFNGIDMLAGFHHDDAYGPDYLFDMVLARHYCNGAVAVGKGTWFESTNHGTEVELNEDGAQYTSVGRLWYRSSLLLSRKVFPRNWTEYTELLDLDASLDHEGLIALDEFNYCRGAEGRLPAQAGDGGEDVNMGATLHEFVQSQRHVTTSQHRDR